MVKLSEVLPSEQYMSLVYFRRKLEMEKQRLAAMKEARILREKRPSVQA